MQLLMRAHTLNSTLNESEDGEIAVFLLVWWSS